MSIDVASERNKVHRLVDVLSAEQIRALRAWLESTMHPVEVALAHAEADDEPLSSEELDAIHTRGTDVGISLDEYLVQHSDKQVA